MFDNLKKKVLKQKLLLVKRGIIELEAQVQFHWDLINYEELSEEQINQYKLAIKSAEEQIKTNKLYVRYVSPLI